MNNFQLPDGPIYKKQTLQIHWLNFVDNEGRIGFESYTQNQIIGMTLKAGQETRNRQFAAMMQKGTWA